MAAYPTLPTTTASKQSIESGRQVVRASNGTLKVRRLYASDKSKFDLEHELSSAQVTTLASFYTTNADLDVTYTWLGDAAAYTVRFASAPLHVPQPGGWFKSYVTLLQV